MSDDEIDKAVKEAAAFEAQDKKRKEGIDTKNEADALVFQTEKAIQEVGDKLDANDKAGVEADCKALKEILEKVNMDDITDAQIAEIKAGKEKLLKVLRNCSQRCMSRQEQLHREHREQVLRQDQRQDRHRMDSRETM